MVDGINFGSQKNLVNELAQKEVKVSSKDQMNSLFGPEGKTDSGLAKSVFLESGDVRDISKLSPYDILRTVDIKGLDRPLAVDIADKEGVVRRGRLVKTEDGDPKGKPLAKVNDTQVKKFLDDIAALGLGLKAEDIMSSNGTLNPLFKIDDNGNISFRDLKAYVNGEYPTYFETQAGGWAEEVKSLKDIMAELKEAKAKEYLQDGNLHIMPKPETEYGL